MGFERVDRDTWERREFLDFFGRTTIYMTVQMDITELYREAKARGVKLYPALIYCAARVFNEYPEFRYAYDKDGNIGIWDRIHPFYTVPRKDRPDLFSMNYTEFSPDFPNFYGTFLRDYEAAENCDHLLFCEKLPENICGMSAVPGVHFSGFSFAGDPKTDFAPFVMFGKWQEENGSMILPVTGEFAHAVNDGFHVSRFFEELKKHFDGLFGEEKRG